MTTRGQQSRIEDLVERSSLGSMRAYLEQVPTFCPSTPTGTSHYVTADNPLPQGRCLNCRQFVRRDQHGRWAVAS